MFSHLWGADKHVVVAKDSFEKVRDGEGFSSGVSDRFVASYIYNDFGFSDGSPDKGSVPVDEFGDDFV